MIAVIGKAKFEVSAISSQQSAKPFYRKAREGRKEKEI
jgi:hypothetical protein